MRGRLHFLTPCMTRSVTTRDTWSGNSAYRHACNTHLHTLHYNMFMFTSSPFVSFFFVSWGISQIPPPPLPLHFVPVSVNLIRIIICTQASRTRASASPSVDLPLPPPHFFPFRILLSSSRTHLALLLPSSTCSSSLLSSPLCLFLSSPYAHAVCLLTRASLPFISHFTVFANCKHILHKLKGEKKTLRGGNKAEMKADEEKREDLLKILQERQKVENMHILCGVCFFHGFFT